MNLILLEDVDRVVLRGRRHAHVRDVHRAAVGAVLRVGQLDGLLGAGTLVAPARRASAPAPAPPLPVVVVLVPLVPAVPPAVPAVPGRPPCWRWCLRCQATHWTPPRRAAGR